MATMTNAAPEGFHVVEKFDGFVDRIYTDSGTVLLRAVKCKTDFRIDEVNCLEIEMDIDRIPETERKHLAEGAYFEWEIGPSLRPGKTYNDMNETQEMFCVFKFKSLGTWTKEDIDKGEEETRKIQTLFGLKTE